MRRLVLLHCPQMAEQAKRLQQFSLATRERQQDAGYPVDRRIEVREISWGRFPDNFPDIFIRDLETMIRDDVIFLASFDNPFVIFEQMSVIYTLAEFNPHSLKILLPYFPTGTMERVDSEGQVVTAATLAQMISALAPAGHGPVPLYIWDIHALQNRHYFGQNITPRFKTGVKYLRNIIRDIPNVSIGYPDAGAWKRFKVMFTRRDPEHHWDFVICKKIRDPNDKSKRVVVIEDGDPSGRHMVVIDDLGHSCGTLIKCGQAMKDAGASAVSCYVTHGVMENEAWKKLLDAGFENVWITDSCPQTAVEVDGQGPFKVISLVPSMYDAIFDR